MTPKIDLRSDTVSRPTAAMRQVMHDAPVGDDVWGDDPTVHKLEAATAELLGKEAAVYVSSGTQSNLIALMAHCQRGDEYIVGDSAHTYRYEAGGAAVLGSIQPQPVRMLDNGMIDLDHVRAVVKPDDPHFARSRLLCVENTKDGSVIGLDELRAGAETAAELGLAYHLDGARMWNAAVDLGVPPAIVAEPFETVSVCLSKGLGAPVGSVLVGPADRILEARKWRKMLGGAMRQAGIIAAAGLHAIEHHIDRLADDHANAARLAEGLGNLPGVEVRQSTNMVFASFDADGSVLEEKFAADGIATSFNGNQTRMVLHLDVSAEDVENVVTAAANHLG